MQHRPVSKPVYVVVFQDDADRDYPAQGYGSWNDLEEVCGNFDYDDHGNKVWNFHADVLAVYENKNGKLIEVNMAALARETTTDSASWSDHIHEVSSPSLSGRI